MFKQGKYIVMTIVIGSTLMGGTATFANATDDSNHQTSWQEQNSQPWWKCFFTYDGNEFVQSNNPSATKEDEEIVEKEQVDSKEEAEENKSEAALDVYEEEVVRLTNEEREKHGLPAFTIDHDLSEVAKEKSQDMRINGYFDHQSPVYGSPFDMMQSFGIDYRTAGENIAMGQQSPEEVVQAWMDSPGHRANILNESFTHIGVGFDENGNYWTQQFIGK